MKQRQHRVILFYSCHPSDDSLRDKLAHFLRPLIREAHVEEWSVQQIPPGTETAQETKRALESATHILLLLSAEYLASDVHYQEMFSALERQKNGEARVIPIRLRPCLLPKPLEGSLSCLPDNGQPVIAWEKLDEAFFDIAWDICQILELPLIFSLRHRLTDRDRLLDQVYSYWIKGLLEPSLKESTHLDLSLQEQPGMLINPWSSQVQELHHVSHPLPTGRRIGQIYDHAHGGLLILGESGAGKTILLLELTRMLLVRAEKDERLPTPVLFNLSSWTQKHQSLNVWLVEELWAKYQIPRKLAQRWIDGDQVLPLLDGLDEVAKDARNTCVKQINDYYQLRLERGSSPIVVCCRSGEYVVLSTRIMLRHVVTIQPLTDEQINTYLEQAGEQVKALRQALNEDTELHSMARQPLMLNIFTLAYQGAMATEVPAGKTPEGMQRAVFARYVERMLNRRGRSKRWKPEQVICWLTFLAKQMQQNDQTVFSVENLQSTWLSRNWNLLSQWCAGLLFLLVYGLVGGLVGPVVGLVVGAVDGFFYELIFGLVVGLVFGFAGLVKGLDSRINPVEKLTWDWKQLQSKLSGYLIAGLCIGGCAGCVAIAQGGGMIAGVIIGMVVPLIVLLIAGLFVGLPLGLSERQLPHRLSPNEGIWRSGKHGLFVGLVTMLIFGLFVGLPIGLYVVLLFWQYSGLSPELDGSDVLLTALFAGLFTELFIALFAGLFAGQTDGLQAFVKHFILRFLLSRQGNLPWNLVAFLDEAVQHLLLRKVGGSYIFVHRLLRDHLASQKASTSSIVVSSDPITEQSPAS